MAISLTCSIQNNYVRIFIHQNTSFKKMCCNSNINPPHPSLLPLPPKHWLSTHKNTDRTLNVLDNFTKMSLDAYWNQLVEESKQNSILYKKP